MAQNLRTPGPTPLPAEVKAALARDMVNHRGPEFAEVLRDCVAGLQWAFDTHNDVLVLTASGTGGLESIVVNTLSPGGRVLVVSIGYFGDRFATIARAFGASVEQLSFPWGRAAHPGQVAERLAADPTLKTVFVTHNETSTGVLNPLADIAAAVREARPEVLLAVDGISSVGSVPIHPDRWQCDVVVAGSQKGWMTPPGLTFVSVSERAWTRQAQARMPRFYFDWQAHRDAMRKGSTPATPAVNLVFGLQAGLAHMRREGLDSIFARHEQVAAFTRAGLVRLGFELFADPTHASPTVTTALPPPDVDVRLLLRRLRERHNVVLAGGQGPYDGRMLRIGHLGDVSEADIAEALAAIEAELPGRRVARLMSHSGGARPRVVVADRIAEAGLQALREQTHVEHLAGRSHDQLLAALAKADALLVRSETHVTRELLDAAPQLRVVGRAGAGVDTIDVEAATARGIVVVNAPGGNAVAAAEHTLALLFALARRVAAADAAIKRGEWSRSSFLGVELTGKTLGLIGLGRVGTEVGRRAIGLEMRVLVYDPYVPSDHIRRSGFEAAELDELLTGADVVSLHVPLTEVTRGILDRQRLALLREGALLINCARGGLVDEGALLSALDTGHLAGAGLDVFSHEPPSADDPLALHPRVVATPHLGASTVEAQVSVAAQVADEVLAVLHGQPAQFAVNAPTVRAEEAPLVQPYVELARMLGKLATQLANGHLGAMEITYRGEIAEHNVSAVSAAAVQGMLESISETQVNLVNARLLAQQRGLEVVETRSATPAHYTSLVQVAVRTDRGTTSVAGAVSDGTASVVGIDDYDLHLEPTPGYMLVTQHTDQPGIIGLVGTVLGQADINISSMQVGRRTRRGQALMLLAVDEPVPAEVLARIRTEANIASMKVISL